MSISVDHLQKDFDYVILNQSRRNQTSNHAFTRDAYSAYNSAEWRIMIHEKTISKSKQSVESIESESFDAEQRFSSWSMKKKRRVSIIFIEIFDDELENAKISYHVRNVAQLKDWLKKDENALIKAWIDIRDESIFVINEYNKKVMKFDEFIDEYNDRIDELNDAKLIIRELKVELRERDLENNSRNSNTFLLIIEDDVTVSTFKKLLDSFVFIDDKDLIIDDWLSIMHNKMKDNAN